jgi:hypothetical protein
MLSCPPLPEKVAVQVEFQDAIGSAGDDQQAAPGALQAVDVVQVRM